MARNAKQAEGVMRARELKLTPQDIAEIEGTAAAYAGRSAQGVPTKAVITPKDNSIRVTYSEAEYWAVCAD